MPVRRPRTAATKELPPLTLGFVGTGESTAENTEALLLDYVAGKETTFVVLVTKGSWTESLQGVLDFADGASISFEIVTDGTADTDRSIKKYLAAASKVTKAAKVGPKLVSVLEKAEGAELAVLWNDDDADTAEIVEAAIAAAIPCLDLTNGLEELTFEEEGDETAEADGDEPAAGNGGSDEPYTEAELTEMDRAALVEICEGNGIEVPNKARAATLVKLILTAQEEASEDDVEPDEEPEAEDAGAAARERIRKGLESREAAEEAVGSANGHSPAGGLSGACPHCGSVVTLSLSLS